MRDVGIVRLSFVVSPFSVPDVALEIVQNWKGDIVVCRNALVSSEQRLCTLNSPVRCFMVHSSICDALTPKLLSVATNTSRRDRIIAGSHAALC